MTQCRAVVSLCVSVCVFETKKSQFQLLQPVIKNGPSGKLQKKSNEGNVHSPAV